MTRYASSMTCPVPACGLKTYGANPAVAARALSVHTRDVHGFSHLPPDLPVETVGDGHPAAEAHAAAANPTEALLAVLDTGKQWIELTAGYRQRAIEAGFTPEQAAEMAVEFHRWALTLRRKP